MRKQIAVMICAISFDNQRKILEGIMAGAKEKEADVFVFTNHVNYSESELNKQGAFQIMELPDFSCFDGVVIVKNTIQYEPAVKRLIENVKKSGIPAVSVDEETEGMAYVGIANYAAQRKIVEHIIHEHKKTDIAYITGHLSNAEGRERYSAYCDALEEAGIRVLPQRVFKGAYDTASGRAAVLRFAGQKSRLPEAIVCANDSMAIGAIAQLSELGYSVPEDVIVTGFDGDDLTTYHVPSITTTGQNQFHMGYEAVNVLLSVSYEPKKRVIIESRMQVHESCGCADKQIKNLEEVREKYVEHFFVTQQASDNIKNMISEFAGLEKEEELVSVLKKYVMYSDMKSFYLCLCEKDNSDEFMEQSEEGEFYIKPMKVEYTDRMRVVTGYENGSFIDCDSIEKREIIPEEGKNGETPRVFIISPVYYQNHCYGYCVSVDSDFPLKSELFFSWVMNIGIGLENIKKLRLLNGTVKRLNGMWVYDMLTHVYNRAGFFYYAEKLLKQLREDKEKACIIFGDVDGLKKINDSIGHKKGDELLKAAAERMHRSVRKGQIMMRYGGDEFVIFGRSKGEEDTKKQVENLQKKIAEENQSGEYDFKVEISMGYYVYEACEMCSLSELIERADANMYEEKKRRKREKKE